MAPKRKNKAAEESAEAPGHVEEALITIDQAPKPRAKRVKKATVSPEPHEASVDRGPEVEELQQPAEEQPASATLELPQVEHAEGDAADEQHEILDNGQAAVPEQAMEYHADHAATEAPYQHPITATEFEDQRVLELLGSLESGTAALRTGEQVDTQHFLHEVEQITAGVEADPAAAYIPEYVGYPTYSDQKPKKRSARNTGGRAKTVAVPHKKFRIDDKVFLVAEDQWYRVTGFFEGLAAEGVAQVSAATKKMTASAINGDVGTKVVQMDAEDAPNTKLWAAADPGLADVVGTPVPEAAPSFDGSVSEMAPGSPAPTKAKDIRPKDRDFWTPERVEALRQGVILFAPYRDRDSLAVAYYYSTGIFGERKGPALKDKRRNILSKILRQKRENVTLDDMLPWVWSLVNPTEKIYWDHFEQTNPTWKEEAAEKLWPIRATLMAQMEVAEEDLIAPGARTAKDPWWAEWEERKAAELAAHYAHGYHYPEEAYHAQEGEAAAYETQHEHEQEQPPPQ